MIPLERSGPLGMGCWQLGGVSNFGGRVNGYGQITEEQAISTVHAALDNGIRFFDTADAYGHGRSEELLGKALGLRREEVVVCTKFGAREDANGQAYHDLSADHLVAAVEGSLRRLGTDRLDILLIHGPPDDTDWSAMDPAPYDALISAGKIRAYGVSSRSVHGAQRVAQHGFGSFIEVILNLLDRRAEQLVFPLAHANGQRIIARVPLASGFLSERSLKGIPHFSADDLRSSFPKDQVEWMVGAVRDLAFLTEQPGGLARSALRYVIHHPGVHVAIPGMRDPAQVLDCVQAFRSGPLPPEIVQLIVQAVPEVFHKWR